LPPERSRSEFFLRPLRPREHQKESFLFTEERMSVQWIKEPDTALAQAKTSNKPVLLDFSAAPA
jgi:uncharacterized protein YyaL (SSP411 family)